MVSEAIVRRALSLAKKRPPGVSHIAVLFKGSQVVAWACNNKIKTSPACADLGFEYAYIHAEVAVIAKYLRSHELEGLKGLKMFVLRFKNRGREFAPSRPCEDCRRYLSALPLKEIYWLGTESPVHV